MSDVFKLYVPFYTPGDPERKQEIYSCLEDNIKANIFQEIILLIDDNIRPNIPSSKTLVTHITIDRRPMYSDWIFNAKNDSARHISICANADIVFNKKSLIDIKESLTEKSLICLCRHEESADMQPQPHPNPQWTQDIWAIRSEDFPKINTEHLKECRIPFGLPRCDGKFAWVFYCRGWALKNPCFDIITLHRHRSEIREYKSSSKTILGGICWVYPCKIDDPESDLEVQLFILNETAPVEIHINRSPLRLK